MNRCESEQVGDHDSRYSSFLFEQNLGYITQLARSEATYASNGLRLKVEGKVQER